MDDWGPEEHARGDVSEGARVTVAKHQPWSCVDYVDTLHHSGREPTKPSRATKPESGDGLRVRFGDVDGAEERTADSPGRCQERTATGRTGECGSIREIQLDNTGAVEEHKWWKEKRTNRGWPGTAEGKINTAQGMAGDLVNNLDSEEKSAVAGIWSGE